MAESCSAMCLTNLPDLSVNEPVNSFYIFLTFLLIRLFLILVLHCHFMRIIFYSMCISSQFNKYSLDFVTTRRYFSFKNYSPLPCELYTRSLQNVSVGIIKKKTAKKRNSTTRALLYSRLGLFLKCNSI